MDNTFLQDYNLAEILKIVSYGSELRETLEKLAKSNRGTIVVLSEKALSISEGGFRINTSFTSEKLAELAKMDGALIIDSNLQKIICANALLTPNTKIKSRETGTKHKAGERTAKQLGVIVVVVSEKSSIISVYYGDKKYTMNSLNELLYKAREIIENLERQRAELDTILKRFDYLELSFSVKLEDLAQILNKIILFFKDSEIASIYIAELGRYGETLKTRFNLVTDGLLKEISNIERDYRDYFNIQEVIKKIKKLKTPTLDQSVKILTNYSISIEKTTNMEITLEKKQLNKEQEQEKTEFSPLGYRILSKIPNIGEEIIENLLKDFGNLSTIINTEQEKLTTITGITPEKAQAIKNL